MPRGPCGHRAGRYIADLIKKRYLKKFVADRPRPDSPDRGYADNRPTTGDIQTIHGGFGLRGCSTSSQKRHTKEDNGRVEEEVYNLSMPIILIDNGNSVDILFISAFDKMRIGLDRLHPFHSPLVGFGGGYIHHLGWIKLPLTLGVVPHQTTVWQDFIVVDCPSPYNSILGKVRATKKFPAKRVYGIVPPPLLIVPNMGEEPIFYLSMSPTAVSEVIVKEEDKVQRLVYYVSKVLLGVETRYLKIKKLAYTLIIAARKLCHYFQAHPIGVFIDQPLKQILQQLDTSGQLLKWSIELSEFHINYRPRMAIKTQALADFIAEFTYGIAPNPKMEALEEHNQDDDLAKWKSFVDGSSNQHYKKNVKQ
ncbi:hypothetical protein Acr_22g0007510 [Actinidia rufa]|uniref:Reverse transcriptase RNase H-like domain-containing protein n=1 Tax=Actinidia rufa TaxID=165716 RepID=A0A7J0GKM9_9ERIC|nr:hypothetical protein Acr_22g0007510 [Actinidia rufa]